MEAATIICKICNLSTKSSEEYFKHMTTHKGGSKFQCAVPGCELKFGAYSSFAKHGRNRHKKVITEKFSCPVEGCDYDDSFKFLMRHLDVHFKSNILVPCVFRCNRKPFKTYNSLRLHNRYFHRNASSNNNVNSPESENNEEITEENTIHENLANTANDELACLEYVEQTTNLPKSTVFMVGKLLLKLIAQKHTQQAALRDLAFMFGEVATLNEQMMRDKCEKYAANYNLNDEACRSLKSSMMSDDLFNKLFDKKTGILRTTYMQMKFFKEHFLFVPAVQVSIGSNNSHQETFYHYVSVLDTLKAFLQVKPYFDAVFKSKRTSPKNFATDYVDGVKYQQKKSMFSSKNVDIFFYQDCAEVVNPLGNAKKKHKLLCCYMVIGNLEPHFRALTENVFLVLLCKEKDFIQFGAHRVFRNLIEDLKILECDGIIVEGYDEPIKGSIFTTLGDNLGAHQLANITENFSTSPHFCLYCYTTLDDFRENPYQIGEMRSPTSHKLDIEMTENSNQAHRGVKGECIFNELKTFHMFDSGAAPCIAHDIFEGWANYDLFLIFQKMIKLKMIKKNYLEAKINAVCKKLKLNTNMTLEFTRKSKCFVGKAVDIWHLIQVLPLIMIGIEVNYSHSLIIMLILIKRIVDITVAPIISEHMIQQLTEHLMEYTKLRTENFDVKLRPKFHFTLHYPHLFRTFGPLVRFHTLFCERKHSYFKRALRSTLNYKNVTKFCSDQHQLYQAYLHSDEDRLQNGLVLEKSVDSFMLLNQTDQNELKKRNMNNNNMYFAKLAKYMGNVYHEDDLLFLNNCDEGGFTAVKIKLLIHDKHSNNNYIYGHKIIVNDVNERGLLKIDTTINNPEVTIINLDDFVDATPLKPFKQGSNVYIFITHAIPSV
uniref:(northern house mosquito) hypothetical protein n=1 Tax=Culex pipiens TaxID=7175 RepID=A0A8D8BYS5_CULPI